MEGTPDNDGTHPLGTLRLGDTALAPLHAHTAHASADFQAHLQSLKDALERGVSLTLRRDVNTDSVASLRDYVRFVDDELRGVQGIEFHLDPRIVSADLDPLMPFIQSAIAECSAREVGSAWKGRDDPRFNTHPPIGPQERAAACEPEFVIVVPLRGESPNFDEAISNALTRIGGLPRFIHPRRLTASPERLAAFAQADVRDQRRFSAPTRARPWVLLNLGRPLDPSEGPFADIRLIQAVAQACLNQGTLPHLGVALEEPSSAQLKDLETLCVALEIPLHILRPSEGQETPPLGRPVATQAAPYGASGRASLVFDFVICLAAVQSAPYVGAFDQSCALLPPATRAVLMDTCHARWKRNSRPARPLTAWVGEALAEGLRLRGAGGLTGRALPVARMETLAQLPAAMAATGNDGMLVDLVRASQPDLWLLQSREMKSLIAGTDPVPLDRLIVDATDAQGENLKWLRDAARLGDPYASHAGSHIIGDIPAHRPPPPSKRGSRRTGKGFTVLGIGCTTLANHSATLLRDGQIVAAVQEERLRRRKQLGWHPPGRPTDTVVCDAELPLERAYPWRSIEKVLEMGGLDLGEVDVLAYNGLPARFLSTYSLSDPSRAPKTLRFGRQMFIPHHLAHAASAYRVSGMTDDSFIFTVDGRGERETAAFFEARGGEIHRVFDILCKEDSLIGGVYEYITTLLGFGHHGQGSTMGLASLGKPTYDLSRFLSARHRHDTTIHDQGILEAFGHLARGRHDKLTREHANLAASVQAALEDTVLNLLIDGLDGRRPKNLCLAGGVALNCSMNQRIKSALGVENVFIQPAAHDAGTSLGAALEAHWQVTGEAVPTHMRSAHLGVGYSDDEIERALKRFGVRFERRANVATDTAELLAGGNIVCWFQGRYEFGPRALGARSILADPRDPAMKDRLNRLKRRESWRPFGPSMLAGTEAEYLEIPFESPFMLFAFPVRRDKCRDIPVVIHKDGTTRPQSVRKEDLPLYWEMIEAFRKLTGIPMVVNTSFNTGSEPIVASPEDAIGSFLDLGADALVIGNFLVRRKTLV